MGEEINMIDDKRRGKRTSINDIHRQLSFKVVIECGKNKEGDMGPSLRGEEPMGG